MFRKEREERKRREEKGREGKRREEKGREGKKKVLSLSNKRIR